MGHVQKEEIRSRQMVHGVVLHLSKLLQEDEMALLKLGGFLALKRSRVSRASSDWHHVTLHQQLIV